MGNAHQPAVDAFHERYKARYGAAPTWNGKTIAQMKRLVSAHGADETVRRIGVLFSDAPHWMSEPYTVALLVGAFDHLVIGATAVKQQAEGLSGDELRKLAEGIDDDS